MKAVSGREFARVLERRGWTLLRVHSSHHYYASPDGKVRVSIPIHGNESLKIGILRDLMKRAGLEERDLT